MSERYKLCESCGSEFQPRVEACLDCGGPLVEVEMGTHLPPRRKPAPPEPPPDDAVDAGAVDSAFAADEELVVVCRESLDHVEAVAAELRDAAVRHAVVNDDPKSAPGRYLLLVAAGDLPAARELNRRYLAALVPDAAFVDLDADGCPACGTPRSPGAGECGECGLTLDFAPEDLAEVAADGEDGDDGDDGGESRENTAP